MYSKHTHKTVLIMKNALRYQISAMILAGGMIPMAAGAFVDERTPPPAPVIQTPPPVAPIVPFSIPGVKSKPVVAAATVNSAAPAGVTGDITDSAWNTPYPGPYGQMPLADALIAQVVPVVGKAIELSGSPELLTRRVNLVNGSNRLDTLKTMASGEGIGIAINGTTVTLTGSGAPIQNNTFPKPVMPATTVAAVPAVVPASTTPPAVIPAVTSNPLPVVSGTVTTPIGGTVTTPIAIAKPMKAIKTWQLQSGTMLSTAMLDWADKWGWKLIWKAEVDYRIAAPITIDGDFLDAVGQVLDAYKAADRPLWGDWNDEQKVLVVREPSNRDR